ncbi:MAG: DUF2167 domain-containing protein [Gammaproteobacteria bacterium]|nr:DUF2167 domain-containing protein [Gammaproteobacteria bacterium]
MSRTLIIAMLLGWSIFAFAAEVPDAADAHEHVAMAESASEEPHADMDDGERMSAEDFIASLQFQDGTINLPGDIASIRLSEDFRYLNPEDAERVLVAWGNPPGNDSAGMLVPRHADLFSPEGWAVIISYEEDGYVSDEDADSIDYTEMLHNMQAETDEENKQRIEAGYESIQLIGWAAPPHYDSSEKKLYWARELKFGNEEENILNYNIRVLGRKGVLVLNAVAGMSQLATVETGMQEVLAITDFNPGNRYAEFDPDVDEVAAYGIGALVAGKLAANAGLFAKLGVLLLALKKYLVLIVIAAGAVAVRLFKRKSS